MSDERSRDRNDGAHSTTGGRRKGALWWLPWAALGLLLLAGGVVFLIARNVGDDSDDAGVDVVDDAGPGGTDSAGLDGQDEGEADGTTSSTVPASASTTGDPAVTAAATGDAASASTDPASASSSTGAVAAPSATGSAGALVVGGQSILPVPAGGLAPLANQPATGTAVTVESVVADEGFWVGTSTDRVFVFLTPQARTTEGESPFQVQAGQLVTLEGTLVSLPGTPADLGVDADEGADQLSQQGHIIEATSVVLA